jgi:hypothetical protein
MLDIKDFDKAIGAIDAEWRSGESLTATMSLAALWAVATVGPFLLEIHHKGDGSIGWVSVDARVGGGVQLWRSRNEQRVPLPEVIDGMREYLRGVAEELAALEPFGH